MSAPLPVTATIRDGDYGRQYAEVTIGGVTVVVYQSEVRPGGVTIDIDTDTDDTTKRLSVTINDWNLFGGES